MKFPKPLRVVDKKLLAEIRKQPCCVCGKKSDDAHHLVSRGAGGGDVRSNLAPLCRIHHRWVHNLGIEGMKEKFPLFKTFLVMIGFRKDLF